MLLSGIEANGCAELPVPVSLASEPSVRVILPDLL